RADILRQDLRLAQSELCGGRTRFPALCIDHPGAVAKCPKSRLPRNGEGTIADQRSPFVLLQRERLHQRVWHRARKPDQGLRPKLSVALYTNQKRRKSPSKSIAPIAFICCNVKR